MKPRRIDKFDGSDEIDAECHAHGFFKIVVKMGAAYWCTIAADRKEAVVVMAAAGGELGKESPYIAAVEALEAAISRKGELINPDGWIK